MLVRPRCAQCTNVARWNVHLYLHKRREGRQVCFCGTHVKPFRAQQTCSEWTVTDVCRTPPHGMPPVLSREGLRAGVICALVGLVVFWIPGGALLWWLFA